jgi:hypothetical protein
MDRPSSGLRAFSVAHSKKRVNYFFERVKKEYNWRWRSSMEHQQNEEISVTNRQKIPKEVCFFVIFLAGKPVHWGTCFGLRYKIQAMCRLRGIPDSATVSVEFAGSIEALRLKKEEFMGKFGINEEIKLRRSKNKSKMSDFVFLAMKEKEKSCEEIGVFLQEIAEKTGLSYSWLQKFALNIGGDCASARLEILYECLTGHEIEYRGGRNV